MKVPKTLVTVSANGELVLWYLESGQPYKMHQIINPITRLIFYIKVLLNLLFISYRRQIPMK